MQCAERRDITIGTATLVGDPADELLEYTERVGADLVALGTCGTAHAGTRLAGSVTADLARRVGVRLPECAVLVCPDPAGERPRDVALRVERGPGQTVVTFLDGGPA